MQKGPRLLAVALLMGKHGGIGGNGAWTIATRKPGQSNHMTSIVLGQYSGGKLVYKGHVTLGVGDAAFAEIQVQTRALRPPFDEPVPTGHDNEDARWAEPRLVYVAEFMHRTKNSGMR